MSSFVYFIRPIGMDGPVKIGLSSDPDVRVTELDRFSPFKLEVAARVPGDKDIEGRIQNCFADCHCHGEWFLPHPRLLEAVAALSAGVSLEAAIDLNDHRGNVRGNIIRATMKRNGTSCGRKARAAA